MVTLYSQPSCAPCRVAKKRLEGAGIAFDEINIQEDEAAAERLRQNGFTGTPVLGFGGHLHTLSGLPEIIAAHAKKEEAS